MAANKTTIDFNQDFFGGLLRSAGITALAQESAERVLAQAQATAPVLTGAYRAGLRIERVEAAHRTVFLVGGVDRKTLVVESRTGNLARALKSAGR